MGSLTNFTIWVDDQKLCKISNGKYFKVPVKAGTHIVSAKRGGVGVMKKETEVEVDVENGKSAYISCSMKSSITRVWIIARVLLKISSTQKAIAAAGVLQVMYFKGFLVERITNTFLMLLAPCRHL
jgi:Protein of unknown function (DUF2846)